MRKAKTFGELVAEERKKNKEGSTQQGLATMASTKHTKTVAASTISRIEQGAVPISMDLGKAIIKALNPSASKKRELREALNDYVQKFKAKQKLHESGKVLDEIMKEFGVSDVELAQEIAVKFNRSLSYQAVQQWRSIRLMSDKMLIAVSEVLKKKGATLDQLRKLKRQHIYDVLMDMQRLDYLDKDQREKLARYGAKLL